jgi:hypothetical protein
MDVCAWCATVKNTWEHECTNCGICGKFIHGCYDGRLWMKLEEHENGEHYTRGRRSTRNEGDILVCGKCCREKRQFKDLSGKDIPVDEKGRVLEDQPCYCCQKPCRGYRWQCGRMRFDCAECFAYLMH